MYICVYIFSPDAHWTAVHFTEGQPIPASPSLPLHHRVKTRGFRAGYQTLLPRKQELGRVDSTSYILLELSPSAPDSCFSVSFLVFSPLLVLSPIISCTSLVVLPLCQGNSDKFISCFGFFTFGQKNNNNTADVQGWWFFFFQFGHRAGTNGLRRSWPCEIFPVVAHFSCHDEGVMSSCDSSAFFLERHQDVV